MTATAKSTKPRRSTKHKHPKPKPPPANWLHLCSKKDLPYGPRLLYVYLHGFKSRKCCLYNYRLAQQFHVTDRTIRLWLAWLRKTNLVHIVYHRSTIRLPNGYMKNGPRIIHCHHFRNPGEWLLSRAARVLKKIPPRTRPSLREFEASRQRNLAALQTPSGWNKISAYSLVQSLRFEHQAAEVSPRAKIPPGKGSLA